MSTTSTAHSFAATLTTAIFDMDGLLIDSEPLWCEAEQSVFADLGIDLTEAMCAKTRGLRIDEVVRYWYARHPWRDTSLHTVAQDVLAKVSELIDVKGEALAGALPTLARLHQEGYRLALASSSPQGLIQAVVGKFDIGKYFEVMCSAAEEELGKPHPAIYLTTAARLGVSPRHCVAFEDSLAGVKAAKAAGMQVVAVPAQEQFDVIEFNHADLKLHSLENFSMDQLPG